ncbi:hypothetical protein [Streptomyces anulatus]|uniref:hypothetical protein n=1 Tax=Streptomyces anulatus TaxID=1892 RepID=UPI002F916627
MAFGAVIGLRPEIEEVLAQWECAEDEGSTGDSEREAASDMATLLTRILETLPHP